MNKIDVSEEPPKERSIRVASPRFRSGRWFGLAALVLLSLASSGCLKSQTMTPDVVLKKELSPKLNPFVFYEDGPVLFVGVDGRAAQYVKEGSIFPLGIGLANQGRTPLRLSRESFVLETADGNRYPLVSHREYRSDYNRSRIDARLLDSFLEVLNARFTNYRFTDWRLFPFSGESTPMSESVELGRLFWTSGYLYFPIPEGGIHGQRFTLLVDSPQHEETFIVRFELK